MVQFGASLTNYLAAPSGTPPIDPIFKAAVDDLFAHGQVWTRFGANQTVVLNGGSCTATSLSWNTANITVLKNAINYIRSKGMKVYLYCEPPTTFTAKFITANVAAGVHVLPLDSTYGLVVGSVVNVGTLGAQEGMVVQSISGLNVTMTTGTAYAHTGGIDVHGNPTAASTSVWMPESDYLNVISMWASYMGQQFAGLVDVWQIGNENNIGDVRNRANNGNLDYSGGYDVPTLSILYLQEMADMMAAARAGIRLYDTAGLITTNVGSQGLTYDSIAQAQYLIYFAYVQSSIDILAMDQYDGMSSGVNTKVGYLNALKTRFGMDIIIAEMGTWWNPLGFPGASEAQQAQFIPQQVAALKQANPLAIILFQYRDEASSPQYLGVVKNDGTTTLGYNAWWTATSLPPTMTAISPTSAPITGGTIVGIIGTNFIAGQTTITFDGLLATSVNVLSPTALTCIIPAHTSIGSSYVVLTTPGGAVASAILFTYTSPQNVVTSAGIVTYATNALVKMQDVGTGNLRAHIYPPVPLGTPDALRVLAATVDVDAATVVMTQVNRFDGHSLTLKENNRKVTAALVVGAQIDLEEPGLGIVARCLVTKPVQAVAQNGDGTITVETENLTDEMNRVSLGINYVDQQEIGQVVRNMGAATTTGESKLLGRDATGRGVTSVTAGTTIGWKADYLDDRTTELSAAPVAWGPSAGGSGGGTIVDLVANGNSIRRDIAVPTNPSVYPSATGLPGHDDPNAALDLTWQVVVPTAGVMGFVQFLTSVGQAPAYGFQHAFTTDANGVNTLTAQVVDGNALQGSPFVVATNTRFKVELFAGAQPARFYYYIQQPTDTAWVRVYLGTGTPAPPIPYFPGCAISIGGGEFSNCVVTHVVPMSRIWWQVKEDGVSNLGGLLNLAQDTGEFLRQALDPLTGMPLRALEFGPLGENSQIRLVGADAADLTKLKRNPRVRIVKEVTEYSRVDNVVTVLTPLGGGTYPARLDLERCYLMLFDAGYEHFYGLASGGIASVFPEYNGDYTIHRTATSGGYQYYIRYDPAFLMGGIGEINGGVYLNQAIGYPPDGATSSEQELAARTLYASAAQQMRAGMRPRVTFTCTLFGIGRPPRAGSKVSVDYTHLASDRNGPYVPLRITTSPADDGLWRVLKVTRTYGAGEPEDEIILSSSGKYGDAIEAATGEQRQFLAQQIGTSATTSNWSESTPRESLDALNPIVRDFYLNASCIRLTKARYHVRFAPYVQAVKTSDNPSGTPIVTVGDVDIELPTPADINLTPVGTSAFTASGVPTSADQIGGMPTHRHKLGVLGIQAQAPTASSHWVGVIQSGDTILTAAGISGQTQVETDVQIVEIDLSPTKAGHTVPIAKKVVAAQTTIAHIPAGQVLGPLPTHQHDIPPDMHELTAPTQISLWIDSGDGVFIDRSAEVSDGTTTGPWTGDFIFEASRFLSNPGRDMRVKFVSTNNPDGGRGALIISVTYAGIFTGTDQIGSSLQ